MHLFQSKGMKWGQTCVKSHSKLYPISLKYRQFSIIWKMLRIKRMTYNLVYCHYYLKGYINFFVRARFTCPIINFIYSKYFYYSYKKIALILYIYIYIYMCIFACTCHTSFYVFTHSLVRIRIFICIHTYTYNTYHV